MVQKRQLLTLPVLLSPLPQPLPLVHHCPIAFDAALDIIALQRCTAQLRDHRLHHSKNCLDAFEAGRLSIVHPWECHTITAHNRVGDLLRIGYAKEEKLVCNSVAQHVFNYLEHAPRKVQGTDLVHPIRAEPSLPQLQFVTNSQQGRCFLGRHCEQKQQY